MALKNKIYKGLKKSEKYTKTDMVYLTKGGFWLACGQIATAVSGLLLTLVFANFATKELLGAYRYILSVAGILAIPSLSGMDIAFLQAVSRKKEGSFQKALKTKLKWGSLGIAGSIIIAIYYFLQGNNTLALSFVLISAFIPLLNSFSLYNFFWQGKKRFDIQNKIKSFVYIVSALTVSLVVILTKNLYLIIFSYFFIWSFLHLLFLILTKKKCDINTQEDSKTISYGKHLSLIGSFSLVNSHLDKIIIWHFLGADYVAIYFIALSLPIKIKEILKIVSSLALPKYAEKSEQELKETVPQKMRQIFFITVPIIISYILLAPFLYKILFPAYKEFVSFSQVYILILLTFPRTLLGTSLTAKMKTKQLYLGAFILSPIYIILLLLLIPFLGIWGAILAFLILEVITFFLQLFFFKKM